ncbi:molybdopterin-binding protein [Massilia horti]|uniref:Molybdopterin-binding protein n=2 Tax=Massilia horti TaxID=2562153 RepID=A0A4Y9T128_9BURK|nr:molybdopterin-binding protein [Massilia horti]
MLRRAQYLSRDTQALLTGRNAMAQEFTEDDIADEFRSNGTAMPDSHLYRQLLAGGFRRWQLGVGGLVAAPAEFSLADLHAMPSRTQITRHDCVEGWSVIGKWTGVPLSHVLARVQPLPMARYVVFHCADPMDGSDLQAPGSTYYESIDLTEARHPQTILAYALNDEPLPVKNGAPLRLRVERQLGYKHAKYLMRIELVERLDTIRGGNGGYWEDLGYEWYAGI